MNNIKNAIHLLLSKDSELDQDRIRSKYVLRSTVISFSAKAATILLGLMTMPLVYNSLDKYQYGVYVTLTSIITWIDMFDFGIANGLRNKLTEAVADNNPEKGRRYISTSYALMSIIAIAVLLLYLACIKIINWQKILNAPDLDADMLNAMALWVLVLFLVRFVVSIIRNVYYAFQQAYMVDVTQMIGKVIYLIVLVGLVRTNKVSLFNVAVIQSGVSALVPILITIYFFGIQKREYAPSVRTIDPNVVKDIMGLGWQFFVIQLALLVIHSGNNLLISQFVDPSSVPPYSLSYQLFSYAMLAYTIIITPLWSAYTEAWHQGRIDWIKQTMKRLKQIFFLFVIACMIVVVFSPWIFHIWIGPNADVPVLMSLAVAIMVLLDMWTRIYDYFINGVGKIRVQLIINVMMASVNIALAYSLSVVLNLGAIGIVLASIISYSISAIVSPIQAKKILDGTAKGVWNK